MTGVQTCALPIYFVATAKIVRKGSRIAVVHTELHNDAGELIATGAAAYVIG